jgi:hypothetical protein
MKSGSDVRVKVQEHLLIYSNTCISVRSQIVTFEEAISSCIHTISFNIFFVCVEFQKTMFKSHMWLERNILYRLRNS